MSQRVRVSAVKHYDPASPDPTDEEELAVLPIEAGPPVSELEASNAASEANQPAAHADLDATTATVAEQVASPELVEVETTPTSEPLGAEVAAEQAHRSLLPAIVIPAQLTWPLWVVRLLLVASGIGLGIFGQLRLEQARAVASVLPENAWLPFIAGAVLLVLGAWNTPTLLTAVPAPARTLFGGNSLWWLAGVMLVAAIAFVGNSLVFFNKLNTITADPVQTPIDSDPGTPAWLFFLAGLACFGLALIIWEIGAGRRGGALSADPGPDQLPRWLEGLVLAGFFLAALFVRFNNLDNAPPGLWFDEAQNGIVGQQIVAGAAAPHPLFITGYTQMGALFFYLQGLLLKFFGAQIYLLRVLPAFAGAIAVPIIYVLASRLYGWRTGLAAAAFLCFSIWSITMSRFGVATIVTTTLDLAVITCLVLALRSGRLGWYGLAGLLLGLNLHMYYGARVLPLVIVAVFAHKLVSERWRFIKGIRYGVPLFVIGALLGFAPMALYALQHPSEFWGRINTVVAGGSSGAAGIFASFQTPDVQMSLQKHLLMFNWVGDANPRHNFAGLPMLDTLVAGLFLVGLGYCVAHFWRWQYFFPVVWLGTEMLGGILSVSFEAPQGHRTMENMVTTALLAGIAAGAALNALRSPWLARLRTPQPADLSLKRVAAVPPVVVVDQPRHLRLRIGQGVAAVLVLVMAVQLAGTALARYDRQSRATPTWLEMYGTQLSVARLLLKYDKAYEFYVSPRYIGLPPQAFLAPNINPPRTYDGAWALPFDITGRDVGIIADLESSADMARMYKLYPNASYTVIYPPSDQNPVQYVTLLKESDLNAIRGVHLLTYAADAGADPKPTSDKYEPSLKHQWLAADGKFPLRARFEATMRLANSSTASFYLEGAPVSATVTVDGFPGGTARYVAAGLHTVVVEQTVAAAGGQTHLLMDANGSVGLEIAPESLFKPSVEVRGLTGNYYAGGNVAGPPTLARIDPFISFYYHLTPMGRPYAIQWTGKLYIPTDGSYNIATEQISRSTLEVDGQLGITNNAFNSLAEQSFTLKRGFHDIRLTFYDTDGGSHMFLYWTPPSGERTIIPSAFLWPVQGSYPALDAPGLPTLAEATGRLPQDKLAKDMPPAPTPVPQPAQQPQQPSGQPTQPPAGEKLDLPAATVLTARATINLEGEAPVRGVAADTKGNIYVLAGGESKIHKYDAGGKELTSWTVEKGGQVAKDPTAISIAGERVVVLDAATANLLSYDLNGKPLSVVQACACFNPRDMIALVDGSYWLADTGLNRLIHVDNQGKELGVVGQQGSEGGQLLEPAAVWQDREGNLYSYDSGNKRLQRFDRSGHFLAQWPFYPSPPLNGTRISGNDKYIFVTAPGQSMIVGYDHEGKGPVTWQPSGKSAQPSAITATGSGFAVAYPKEQRVLLFDLP